VTWWVGSDSFHPAQARPHHQVALVISGPFMPPKRKTNDLRKPYV
jgi:hypothetical protein